MRSAEQTFELPGADPTLVLLGANDPREVRHLDEALVAEASTVDIRSGVVWLEVPNGRIFLQRLVDLMADDSPGIKVAIADPDSSPQELVKEALLAVDLMTISDALEQQELANAELNYEVSLSTDRSS